MSTRLIWQLNRSFRAGLSLPETCPYIKINPLTPMRTGYIILSYVKAGRMLSWDWYDLPHDTTRRQTLFRGLAKIMIKLNSTPLPRIGSLTMNDDGLIDVTNRPLVLQLQTMENEGIPIIPRDSTYESVEPYISDFLQCHDNRIHYQPNAIHNGSDGTMQLSAMVMMRGIMHQFLSRKYRHGPFLFTLTDLHSSNIFVDENWNVTSILDLEWACALPVELQTPPYWLTCRAIDTMPPGEHLDEFKKVITEFIDIFEEQEKAQGVEANRVLDIKQAEIMRNCWETGGFWYFQAVSSPKGLWRVFTEHIQPRFCTEHAADSLFDVIVAYYWSVEARKVVSQKVEDDAEYKDRIRERFGEELES